MRLWGGRFAKADELAQEFTHSSPSIVVSPSTTSTEIATRMLGRCGVLRKIAPAGADRNGTHRHPH
jgi:hypothetical protein